MSYNSNVLLIYTGGTIGMSRNPLTGALEPLNFEHLLKNVPELEQFSTQIATYQFNPPIDSSDMSPTLWTDIAHIIADNYNVYDGFVVLHGTDTMAYTASALSYMLENLTKPVILTGSQLPIGQLRTDGKENLITSIEYLKQLLQMARELLEAEKEIEKPMDKRAQARAALTDLFQSIKTEDTPFILEQVVNDIDNEVVNIIRQFNDAFKSVTARREIKKKLRSILWIKYQIKDNEVFEKAYSYIEMYY